MNAMQVSEGQYKRVLDYIRIAKEEGARLVTGGGRPPSVPGAAGYYVAPTVFEVEPSMRIWREEIFGPVLSVVGFETEAEAVAL